MQPIGPAEPALSADKREWVDMGAMPPTPRAMPYQAGIVRDPMQGTSRWLPRRALKKKHVNVWDGVVQQDHPPRDTLVYTSSRGLVYTTSSSPLIGSGR